MQLEALRIAPMEDDNNHGLVYPGDPDLCEGDPPPGEFLEDQLDNLLARVDTVVTAGDLVTSGTLTGIAIPCPPAVVNSAASPGIDPASLAQVLACHARVRATESRVEDCKESLKYAKSQHEEAVDSLMRAVGSLSSLSKPLPLFDQPAETEPSMSFAESDAWRSIPISDLGLTKAIAKRLADAGLSTVGKIADHTNAGKRLTDVPGIGEGKAEQIADALERLWAERANHGDYNEGDGDAEESE